MTHAATQSDVEKALELAKHYPLLQLAQCDVPAMAARIDELVVALRDIMYHTRGEHPVAHRIAYTVGAYMTGDSV